MAPAPANVPADDPNEEVPAGEDEALGEQEREDDAPPANDPNADEEGEEQPAGDDEQEVEGEEEGEHDRAFVAASPVDAPGPSGIEPRSIAARMAYNTRDAVARGYADRKLIKSQVYP